jgi:hypothetical protein
MLVALELGHKQTKRLGMAKIIQKRPRRLTDGRFLAQGLERPRRNTLAIPRFVAEPMEPRTLLS